ncbi:uroporphyrinogen-III synthase [Pikeienuella sp. HZG-20]|uniref:uroporphyrinogen-III synthase n=1 Tax=Paludibacillus litoralis TaxID=3133267 RepID=UPI0030EC141D
MPRVLLTRPQAQSEAFATSIAGLGWDALIWPVIEIAPTLFSAPDLSGVDALIFTSARGVEALSRFGAPDLPAFCVGAATAAAARRAGFTEVTAAGGDAVRLLELLKARARGRLMHIRGRDAAADIKGALRAHGIDADEIIAYAAEPAAPPSDGVDATVRAGDVEMAMFFSPRSARIFAATAPAAWRSAYPAMRAATISEAAAAPLLDLGFADIRAAAHPDADAMRALLRSAA